MLNNITDSCPGSLHCYIGLLEPDGWIFCDGLKRINKNNIYNKLIELGVGELECIGTSCVVTDAEPVMSVDECEIYTPPNYDNFVLSKIDESAEMLYSKIININNNNNILKFCHTYIENYKVVQKYNNCNFSSNITDYKGLELIADYKIKQQIESNAVCTKIRWIVKI